jgi:predicted nucleic acid-binding protein
MTMKDKIFIDTNILVYLADADDTFNAKVKEAFKDILEKYEPWISRQVLREYAVVVSRKEYLEKPIEAKEIIEDIEKWEMLFNVADETQDITDNLKKLITKYNLKGKRIHDSNIVASMMRYEISLLFTLNVKDFQAFEEIRLLGIPPQSDIE